MAKRATPVFQFRPHPWHGLDVGPEPPVHLNAFIEITPFDLMKYEVDKVPCQRPVARITKVYGRDHAAKVVTAAMADYAAAFLGGSPTYQE